MAANYKVNIELDTKKLDKQLRRLKTQVEEVGKVKRGAGGGGKKRILSTQADDDFYNTLAIKTRKFARSINPILNKADKVAAKGGMLALPDSNMLNAQVKGIKRLETSADKSAKHSERRAKAEERSAKSAVESMKANQASAKAGMAHARKIERMRGDTGFTAAQYGPQFDGMSLPTESALNFDRRTGKLLRGPAGSGGRSLRNLGRRFDTQSALISGAFPLLFGQGPIGALAGGLGGGIGGMFGQMGGFAGGIAATAIVQTLSNVVDGVRKLGESLTTLDGQFKLLTERSLFSTKEAENRAKVLKALGEREKLATLLSQELATVLGQDGADKLRRAGEASKELSKTIAELSINLQLALAGPISTFLKLVNNVLDQGTAISLGQGKGTVNLGPGEEKFIRSFSSVLTNMNQSQIDEIINAPIGTNVQGLNVTNTRKQAIRKFDLARQTNPAGLDAFMGGGSSFAGGKTPLEVDAARVASAQKKVKAMEKEIKFAKLVTEEGLKEADIQKQIEDITQNLNEEELKLLNTQNLSVRALVEKNNEAKQLVENARMIEASFKSLTQNISTDLAQGIQGLIRGTSTLNDVLNNVLNKMIDAAFNMAFFGNAGGTLTKGLGLFGSIFGGLLATGGPAKAGKSYIVGEKGPELFTPGVSGMVSPNNALGGSTNVVVNVDASGSSVQGNEQQGRELGRIISVAVQSEIIQQQRPGGLLT